MNRCSAAAYTAVAVCWLLFLPHLRAEDDSSLESRGELAQESVHSELRANHPLNPDGGLFDFTSRQSLTSLDLEGDWYGSEVLRFHGRGILQYLDSSKGIEKNTALVEGSVHYQSPSGSLFVDAGKILEEWGSGYSFNPVNVLLPSKNPDSPLKVREGVTMLKLELLFPESSLAAIVAGSEDGSSANQEFVLPDSKERRRFALKLDHPAGQVDLSWVHAQGGLNDVEVLNHMQGDPHEPALMHPVNGVSWTAVFGDALELHGELAQHRGRSRLIAEKMQDAQTFPDGSVAVPEMYVYAVDEKGLDSNYAKFLVGGQYTFPNDINLMLELYHDQNGYSEEEWRKIKSGIKSAKVNNAWKDPRYSNTQGNPYAAFLQRTMLYLQQSGFRKNYGFIRLDSGEFADRFHSESLLLANLEDAGGVFRETLVAWRGDHWKLALGWTLFLGPELSEYGLSPVLNSAAVELSYFF